MVLTRCHMDFRFGGLDKEISFVYSIRTKEGQKNLGIEVRLFYIRPDAVQHDRRSRRPRGPLTIRTQSWCSALHRRHPRGLVFGLSPPPLVAGWQALRPIRLPLAPHVRRCGGGCSLLVPYFFHGMSALYIGALTNGLLFAFAGVSQQNLVGLLSEPENRALNFSNLSLVISTATFVGPLLAGFSIDHSGHAAACL